MCRAAHSLPSRQTDPHDCSYTVRSKKVRFFQAKQLTQKSQQTCLVSRDLDREVSLGKCALSTQSLKPNHISELNVSVTIVISIRLQTHVQIECYSVNLEGSAKAHG